MYLLKFNHQAMKTNEKVRPSRIVARSQTIHGHRQAHSKSSASGNNLPSRNSKRKSKQRSSAVALLSKSFINSINQAIRRIENNEVCPLTVPTGRIDRLDNFDEVFSLFEIPELDDYEYDPFDYPATVERALNGHFKCDDIVISEDIASSDVLISIKELPTETDQPFYRVYEYDEVVSYFKDGIGTYLMMLLTFLNGHGFINEFCGGQGEWLHEMAMDSYEEEKDDNNYDKKELINMLHQSRSIEVTQKRFDKLNRYLSTDIDLNKIADLILTYEPENRHLKRLAIALRELQEFILHFENFYEKYLDETNIYDMIVWFGNSDHTDYYLSQYNENYGEIGTYIKFPHAQKMENDLDDRMIAWWNLARDQFKEFNIKPYKSLISTYDNLLNTLTNAEIITAVTGLFNKSEFAVAFHRELDRMQGCSPGICGKWESIGVSTSFFELLKAAYRNDLGKQKDQLPGHASSTPA